MNSPGDSENLTIAGHKHVGNDILCISNLSYTYPGGERVLKDINLHVSEGTSLGIVGPNGGGKTTLIKIILGLLKGYQGEVKLSGITPKSAREKGTVIGWVPQNPSINWNFPINVQKIIELGIQPRKTFAKLSAEKKEYIDWIIEKLDIAKFKNSSIAHLSGGQKQRAIIARALAPKPQILILDEPEVGIDQAGKQQFRDMIETLKREFNLTLLIVSHDLQTVITSCHRIACMNRELHFHDVPDELTSDLLQRLFQCDLDGLLPSHCSHDHQSDKANSGELNS